MYQVDRKLLNADGSKNLDAAIEAGHQARSQALKAFIAMAGAEAARLIRIYRAWRLSRPATSSIGAGDGSAGVSVS